MKFRIGYVLGILVFSVALTVCRTNGQPQGLKAEAQLMTFEDLAYPPLARTTRIQGVVIVRAEVNEDGKVTNAASLSSAAEPLVSAAVSNVKQWKFKPRSGSFAFVVYEFRLADGACHDASRSLFQLIFPNLVEITACNPVVAG